MQIAVIGAGPSGLAFTKELKERGLEPTCFEASGALGGVFARAYQSCRLTSSNLITAFSDFPSGEEQQPRFWTAGEYVNYLRRYADHFGILGDIRYHQAVRSIRPTDAGFELEVEDTQSASTRIFGFDRVAICCGTHRVPSRPHWPGAGDFRGRIIHTADYHEPSEFAGKRVVVVGAGESASDLSLDVARVAAATCVSVRSRWGHVVPRCAQEIDDRIGECIPNDFDTTRVHHSLPYWTGKYIEAYRFRRALRAAKTHDLPVSRVIAETNLSQGTCDMRAFGCKNASFARAIVEHGCQIKPAIVRVEPDGVLFRDGSSFACDVILCATGFHSRFEFLEPHLPELAREASSPRENLYMHCYHPDYGARIAWGGFARPAFGAIPPMSEMQARWFAALAAGEVELPTPAVMRERIAAHAAYTRRQFDHDHARLTALTDYARYMDLVADELRCKPVRLLRRDPRLWDKVMFGPLTGAQFRLTGVGAKPTLAREILARTPVERNLGFMAAMVACQLLSRLPGFAAFRLNTGWI